MNIVYMIIVIIDDYSIIYCLMIYNMYLFIVSFIGLLLLSLLLSYQNLCRYGSLAPAPPLGAPAQGGSGGPRDGSIVGQHPANSRACIRGLGN